eukprot:jgi/Ulvmu1/3861/UM018_0080.1
MLHERRTMCTPHEQVKTLRLQVILLLALRIFSCQAQVIVNTWPFLEATSAAWSVVGQGGTAVDAVVEGASTCEVLQCDGTVGYGGSPDEAGETTLDAMIMDGETREMGAVGGIRNIRAAARAAQAVKDHTHHSILVGEQAGDFAVAMGLAFSDLTTQASAELHRGWLESDCQPNFRKAVSPAAASSCGPYVTAPAYAAEASVAARPTRRCGAAWASPSTHDTIAMLAVDRAGRIAAGTSTNGACGKVPGRVGDAAIVGAGAYAAAGAGACGATGDGDVMMRFLPCYQAVESMRQGMAPTAAAEDAMQRILDVVPKFQGALVTMNATGGHGGAAVGWVFHYAVADAAAGGVPEVLEVLPMAAGGRGGGAADGQGSQGGGGSGLGEWLGGMQAAMVGDDVAATGGLAKAEGGPGRGGNLQ